jgi:glycerol uptake facilitator protein
VAGQAINPARDFWPRLAHGLLPIAGKGDSNWDYARVPIAGPLLSAIAGSFVFSLAASIASPGV